MQSFSQFFMAVYLSLIVLLSLYGIHRYWILYLYFRYYKWAPPIPVPEFPSPAPRVTVQLPVFNERYVVERLIDAVGYRTEVERCYPDERTRDLRWQGVADVIEFADNHARRSRNATLATFLQDLTLTANDDTSNEEPGERARVMLMTLHSAKGLEFPRVYLVGLEEGLLPHLRSVAEDTVEEERRLMYVGITRARTHLTLCYTKQRTKFGRPVDSMPSRFLYEIKGTPPPADWIPAGSDAHAPKPKAKRKKTTRTEAASHNTTSGPPTR